MKVYATDEEFSSMKELVSVALCTYNGEAFLREQLQSLLGQTYPHLEIIVVDDASTDGTGAIIREFAARGNIRFYQNGQNLGFSRNFEKALRLCSGPYLALCDQDDVWAPQKLATLLPHLRDHLLVYSDAELTYAAGQPMGKKVSELVNPVKTADPLPLLLNNCAPGNTLVFRRELVEQALPIPADFFHDWWLLYAASVLGRIKYVEEPLVQYRQHAANVTNMAHHRKETHHDAKSHRRERTLYHLRCFQDFNTRHGISNPVLDQLIYRLAHKSRGFDLRLFTFLSAHLDELYYVLKKSRTKKLHRILKEAMPG